MFFALALTEQATLWMAVFADMGGSLAVVFNGLGLLRFEEERTASKHHIASTSSACSTRSTYTNKV